MVHEALRDEAESVAEIIHGLALAVEGLLLKHGKAVIEKQFLQLRLANARRGFYPDSQQPQATREIGP